VEEVRRDESGPELRCQATWVHSGRSSEDNRHVIMCRISTIASKTILTNFDFCFLDCSYQPKVWSDLLARAGSNGGSWLFSNSQGYSPQTQAINLL
jgi:hypothetical protein